MSGIIPLKVTRAGGQATGFAEFQTGDTLAPSVLPASVATISFVGAAIAPLAPIASPAFTGIPTAPTPSGVDNSTRIATTAFVQAVNAALIEAMQDLAWSEPYLPISGSGVTQVLNPNPWLCGRFPLTLEAGSAPFVASVNLSAENVIEGAVLRVPIDLAASLNGTINVYDEGTATLLQTLTQVDATVVRSFFLILGFDGEQWNKEDAEWVL